MSPSIWQARFKVEWAKKHLDSIEALVRSLADTGPNRISTYDDIEHSEYVITIRHPPEREAFRIALSIGDFICSLRSSLDHLAWQLALLTTAKPSGELQFPILEKNILDAQVRFAKITFGIPDAAISIMKSMQPYHAGDDFKSTHLWRLNKLWNIDKHRYIAGFQLRPDTWEVNFQGNPDMESIPFHQEQIGHHTIMRLPLAIKENVRFNPDVRVEFIINETSEGMVLLYTDLVDMYEFVDKVVFPAFEGFFPQTEVPGQSPQRIEF